MKDEQRCIETTDDASILDALHQFVHENFSLAKHVNITPSQPLLESGVVDSLGLLTIVTFVETEFGLVVTDLDVTEDNFGSLGSIAAYVANGLAEKQR
uniref:Carrier domain-containing protein n=1 Tax=uncultured bacterium 'To-T 020 P12' TaxID=1263626 RepID=K9NBW3_9BACT|nr:hypothetical protein [uncultured bacterium 'To-T 020 P12']